MRDLVTIVFLLAGIASCKSEAKDALNSQEPALPLPTGAIPDKGAHIETRPAEFILPGSGSVAQIVVATQVRAKEEGWRVVVYVGASWCEPCEVFSGALHENTLPSELADLRFLKFDHDQDADRLEAAGYGGQMIPRFVLPNVDGHGSGSARRFEGAVKGPAAIDHIAAKLQAILDIPTK